MANNDEDVVKRLDIIIQLMLENGSNPISSTTGKIQRLLDFGLSKTEVANILGKKVNYISAVTSGKKKSKKKQSKDKAMNDEAN